MTNDPEVLGGRLPLLDPKTLSSGQKTTYDLIQREVAPWADAAGFRTRTADGRLIGPFNSEIYSPEIGAAFHAWQSTEAKHTDLDERVRQVVILAVGAVWKADYELYAHTAVAKNAGFSASDVAELCAGRAPKTLREIERLAHRFATELTTTRSIEAELFTASRAALGLKGLVDLVQLVGAYQVVCGVLNSFAVPAP